MAGCFDIYLIVTAIKAVCRQIRQYIPRHDKLKGVGGTPNNLDIQITLRRRVWAC